MPVIHSVDGLRTLANELARRWLPMLLTRLSIENAVILEMKSDLGDDEELLRRLDRARVATERVARQTGGETGEVAHSALALIAELTRGIQLLDDDPAAAEAALGRVNQLLLGLLAGLPSSTVQAGLSPSSWWSRLLSRNPSGRELTS
jgi:hypothetical protein